MLYLSESSSVKKEEFTLLQNEEESTAIISQCTQPQEHIVFHKTHKCSSSTIQNILLRYSKNHSLVVVLPESGHHLSPPGSLFNSQTLINTKWYQAGLQPNVFCLHNRWNGPEVSKLYGNTKPFYFSVLRDPVSLLISLWDYYGVTRKLGMKLERFAVRKIKPNRQE